MNRSIPYPCSTRLERDRSLQLCDTIWKNANRTLQLIDSGKAISVNLEFRQLVWDMVYEYAAEIHRLKQVKFTNQGVVEICPK